MKKIICIILTLTLVLASVSLAFAKAVPPEENAPVGGNWIGDGNGTSNYLTRNEATSNVSYHKTYMSAYGDTWRIGYPSNAPEGSVRWAYTFKAEFTNQSSGQNGIAIGNQAGSGSTTYLPVCTFDVGDYVEGNTFTIDWQNYPRLMVKDGYGQFTLLFDAPASNPYWNLYINPNTTSLGWVDLELTLLSVVGDGVVYYGDDPLGDLSVDTYAFNVPYGCDLHIEAHRIDAIYTRANTSAKRGNWVSSASFPDIRYSYSGGVGTSSAFESAMRLPLHGVGSRGVTGGYSEFEGQILPNGKTLNVFNRYGNNEDLFTQVYINVTCLGEPYAYFYKPDGGQEILSGTASIVNPDGGSTTTGGNGTAENPYLRVPVDSNGNAISYGSLTQGGANDPDSLIGTLTSYLDTIFGFPQRIIDGVSGWLSGITQVTSALYSGLPVELQAPIIAFFSIVVLVGVLKIFL